MSIIQRLWDMGARMQEQRRPGVAKLLLEAADRIADAEAKLSWATLRADVAEGRLQTYLERNLSGRLSNALDRIKELEARTEIRQVPFVHVPRDISGIVPQQFLWNGPVNPDGSPAPVETAQMQAHNSADDWLRRGQETHDALIASARSIDKEVLSAEVLNRAFKPAYTVAHSDAAFRARVQAMEGIEPEVKVIDPVP